MECFCAATFIWSHFMVSFWISWSAKVAKKSVRSSWGSDNKEFEPHMVFKSVVASLINSFHVPTVPVNRRAPLALSFCEQIYNSKHNERMQRMKLPFFIFPSSPADSFFCLCPLLESFQVYFWITLSVKQHCSPISDLYPAAVRQFFFPACWCNSRQTQVGITNKNPINLCPRRNKEMSNKFKKTESAAAVPMRCDERLSCRLNSLNHAKGIRSPLQLHTTVCLPGYHLILAFATSKPSQS